MGSAIRIFQKLRQVRVQRFGKNHELARTTDDRDLTRAPLPKTPGLSAPYQQISQLGVIISRFYVYEDVKVAP